MKLRVLDLFSGIGGFSLGLERTGGFETAAFCEIDKAAQKVLKKHWPSVPIFEDVPTLSSKDIDGPIDVICGGFPCQDISVAGKGAGLAGERSGLWFQYHRLIQEIRPKWVIAENVSALRSRGLDQVLRSLSEIGYDAEWHCIPASAVGAPHRRDRIWIVAYPNSGFSDGQVEDVRTGWNAADPSCETLAHPHCLSGAQQLLDERRLLRQEDVAEEYLRNRSQGHGNWEAEPDVGRVAHGVPNRVDRLRQLGNAVVPQIPELIGNAILRTHG